MFLVVVCPGSVRVPEVPSPVPSTSRPEASSTRVSCSVHSRPRLVSHLPWVEDGRPHVPGSRPRFRSSLCRTPESPRRSYGMFVTPGTCGPEPETWDGSGRGSHSRLVLPALPPDLLNYSRLRCAPCVRPRILLSDLVTRNAVLRGDDPTVTFDYRSPLPGPRVKVRPTRVRGRATVGLRVGS